MNAGMTTPRPASRRRVTLDQPRGRAQPPWVAIVVGLAIVLVSGGAFLVFSFAARVGRAFPGPARPPAAAGGGLDPFVSWFAGLFALAGVCVAAWGLAQAVRDAATAARRRTGGREPWLADHPWRREGARDEAPREGRGTLATGVVMLAGACAFAAGFWTQTRGPTRTVGVSAATLAGAAALAAVGWGLHRLLRRARHGRLELRFGAFPFFLGRPLEAELLRPGAAALGPLEATLRCIQEVRTFERSGDDSGWTIHRREVWSEARRIDLPSPRARRIAIRFELPDAPALSTELSVNPPRYWELEVASAAAGLDLGGTFLVPVYAAPGAVRRGARPALAPTARQPPGT